MTEHFYKTIEQSAETEFRDRGSRFIAYAFPIVTVEDFKKKLAALKEQHPGASHHCFAWRLGTDGNSFRVSDDGEPSGSAGRPIMGQIDSKGLTNIGVVVVRYFGGSLLGIPGLINAYKTATALALQLTPQVQKSLEQRVRLQFDYTRMNDVMMILKRNNCSIYKQESQLFSIIEAGIPLSKLDEVLYHFNNLQAVEIEKLSA